MNIKVEEKGIFSGYAAVFNKPDQENDIFIKGSFLKGNANEIDASNIKMLWQHNSEHILGLYDEIYEDDYGLFVKGRLLLDISKAQEAYTMIKNGAINGLSVGFTVEDFYYDRNSNCRIITKTKLWEVSLVTFPASSVAKIENIKSTKDSHQWSMLVDSINLSKEKFSS